MRYEFTLNLVLTNTLQNQCPPNQDIHQPPICQEPLNNINGFHFEGSLNFYPFQMIRNPSLKHISCPQPPSSNPQLSFPECPQGFTMSSSRPILTKKTKYFAGENQAKLRTNHCTRNPEIREQDKSGNPSAPNFEKRS